MGGADGGGITSPDTGSILAAGSTQSSGGSLVILVQIQWVFVGEEYGPTSQPLVSQSYKPNHTLSYEPVT